MSLPRTWPFKQARHSLRGVGVSPALLLIFLIFPSLFHGAELPLKDRPLLRRPIAAAWIETGKLLAVANQKSGTISVVDIAGRDVLDELAVGARLADIAAMPGTGRLLAVDEKTNELIMLRWLGARLSVEDRMEVTPSPVSILIAPDNSLVTISSLWPRKVSIWEFTRNVPRHEIPYLLRGEVSLPFNPRLLHRMAEPDRLLVADAFGGNLAVVDPHELKIVSLRNIDGHNLRGVARGTDPDHVAIAFQRLAPAPATAETIHAAEVIENVAGEFNLHSLLDARQRGLWRGLTSELGEDGGRGDPATLRSVAGRRTVVAISGLAELRILGEFGVPPFQSLPVGRRPTRIAFYDEPAAGADTAWPTGTGAETQPYDVVINTLSDSLSLLGWNALAGIPDSGHGVKAKPKPKPRPNRREGLTRGNHPHVAGIISLGPAPELAPAQRGEELFYDARLSSGWMSCHSCHTDGHTCGLLADTLGDGTHGTPKRIPSLLGTRLSDPWAWNGGVRELHEQVQKSLDNTMHAPKFSPQDVLDITAFLHTLPPPPPLEPATEAPKDIAQLARGKVLFHSLGCAKCHVPPLTYTSPEVYDVGLEDEKGLKKFNPPSLRGVSQGFSFFHDGRAKTLEAVFTEHAHQLPRPLEKSELAHLLRFLRSL